MIMRNILFLTACLSWSLAVYAQPAKPEARTASISGRVTIEGKPVTGAVVSANYTGVGEATLMIMTQGGGEDTQARTDAEGRYELKGLREGKYQLKCISDAYVEQTASGFSPQARRAISVDEGEQLKDVDLALVRGGVITGRVTDAEGKPVIEEMVMFESAASSSPNHSYDSDYRTDDRGVYRFYGLAPGKYRIVVGLHEGPSPWRREPIPRTYAPDVTNVAEAKIIEVTAGSETENIDIRLRRDDERYLSASGKVIDADSGQPINANLVVYANSQLPEGSKQESWTSTFSSARVDASGAFVIERMKPGRYQLRMDAANRSFTETFPYFGEPITITLTESDVSGLEIKVRRGATVSGKAVLDAAAGNDAKLLNSLSQAFISMRSHHEQPNSNHSGYFHYGQIKPDHSFRFEGVPSGKMMIESQRFSMNGSAPSGLTLVRIERDGAVQPDGITISGAESITNLTLVFAAGTGSIRGTVQVVNGSLPDGYAIRVTAHRKGESNQASPGGFAQADDKGRFAIEGLLAGEYALSLTAHHQNWQAFPPINQDAKESVTVSGNQPAQVSLAFNPRKKEQQ
jgi:hypothetical protein